MYGQKSDARIVQLWIAGEQATDPSIAIAYYKQSLALAEQQQNYLWVTNIMADMAGSLYNTRAYQKGAESCLEGIRLYTKHGVKADSVLFKLHANLAVNYHELHKFSQARTHYDYTERLLAKNPSLEKTLSLFVAYNYSNQGKMWEGVQDHKKALIHMEKAALVAENLKSERHRYFILGNLAATQLSNGLKKEGIASLRKVIAYYEKKQTYNEYVLPNFLFTLGSNLENPKESVEAFQRCIYYLKRNRNKNFAAERLPWAYKELVDRLLLAGEISKSKEKLAEFERSVENSESDCYFLYSQGKINLHQKNYTLSQSQFEAAWTKLLAGDATKQSFKMLDNWELALGFKLLNQLTEIRFRLAQQDKNRRVHHLNKALESAELLLEMRDYYQNRLSRLESTLTWFNDYHYTFWRALNVAYELYQETGKKQYRDRAFKLGEQSKSLLAAGDYTGFRTVEEDSIRSLLVEAETYRNRLRSDKNTSATDLNKADITIDRHLNELQKINPMYTGNNITSNFADLIRKIPARTLYLNYVTTDSCLFVFWANSSDLGVERVNFKPSEYHSALHRIKQSLTREPEFYKGFDEQKYAGYLYRLFSTKRKFFDSDAYNRLIISPSSEHFDLSFDVLFNEQKQFYLFEKKAVSYISALSGLAVSRKMRQSKLKWNVFLPFSIASSDRSFSERLLKYDATEVKDIKGDVYSGNAASRKAWFDVLKKEEITLLITHGGVKNGDPYVLFRTETDGLDSVFVSEMKYQKFSSPLVILSACETNTGTPVNGLGMFSLGRVLSLTGCLSVAGSYWLVDDLSMSVLGSFFYRYLEQGYPKDIALQKAKKAYLNTEHGKKFDHPYYWAHFQVYGDADPVSSSTLKILYIAAVLLLVALALFFFRRKKF
jgi:CHAT domain-containing protein